MKTTIKNLIGMLLIAGVGGFAGASIYKSTEKTTSIGTDAKQSSRYTRLTGMSSTPEATIDFTHAAEQSIHAVVHVKTYYPQSNFNNYGLYDPFQDFFWGNGNRQRQEPQQPESSGSGVIISNDGYIVTNNHVVEKASKVEITLNDKRTYTATVIGTDPSTDLALIKIDEKDLPYLSYGNSDELKVGEWVLAVGNPFNLTSTVTAGIVSAKARNINILNSRYPIEAFIQTDAAVNPGNSGGALVNTAGDLVGVNAAIASNTGSYTGYSFAIPVSIVKKVVNDLLEFGEVQRGFIGITPADIDNKLAAEKGIKQLKGVYVKGLTENGSAVAAGLEVGDIITKVGEAEVNSVPELQEQVSRYRPGNKINVTLLRDGKEKTVAVVLRNRNGSTDIIKKEPNQIISLLGAEFENIGDQEEQKLGLTGGAKINKIGPGKLRSAGIREGFIITRIDHNDIRGTEDLMDALQDKHGAVLIEGYYPNGMSAYYAFGI